VKEKISPQRHEAKISPQRDKDHTKSHKEDKIRLKTRKSEHTKRKDKSKGEAPGGKKDLFLAFFLRHLSSLVFAFLFVCLCGEIFSSHAAGLSMSDRDALRAAIIAHPDDDTLRLAFADWLEEHGEAKRAACIRSNISSNNYETADTDAECVYQFLACSSTSGLASIDWSKIDPELPAIHTTAEASEKNSCVLTLKAEGVPRLKGIQFGGGNSGFLCSIHVDDGESFVKHGEEIFRHAPITDVVFDQLDTDDAREIVKRGLLARIRDLQIWDMEEPEALAVLGSHPDAAGVQSMDLVSTYDDDSELINAFVRGRHWTGLRKLVLNEIGEGEEVSDSHQTRLFRKPVFTGLRELEAWGSAIGDAAAKAIAAGGMPELRHLDLTGNEITGEGLRCIARSKGLPKLRFLDLAVHYAEDATTNAELINSPNLANLTVLRMSAFGSGGVDQKPLTKPGRGPGLRALELSHMPLSEEAVQALAACAAVRDLWYLHLGSCDLSPSGLEALLAGSGLNNLAFLSLPNNRLKAKPARVIANWSASALQWLDLSDNPLTPNGLAALADSPHMTGLKYLQVSGKPTTAGFKKLKKRFGKALHRAT
jgi:uncharacterized protein (TIGR02996 family)